MVFRKILAGTDNFVFPIFREASQHGLLSRNPAQSEDAAAKMLADTTVCIGKISRFSGGRWREFQNIDFVIPNNWSFASIGTIIKPSGNNRTRGEVNHQILRTEIYYAGNPHVHG